MSSTVHDRAGVKGKDGKVSANTSAATNSAHAHRSSQHTDRSSKRHQESSSASQQQGAGQQPQSGARDSFLNYFFGGQPGSETPSSVLGETSGQFGPRAGGNGGRTDYLPDLSKGEGRLAGRRGLEGSGAAFDMKSLQKHLDPVSRCPSRPTSFPACADSPKILTNTGAL